MIQLHNDTLQVDIHPKGAELQRILHKQNGLDYMWSGDAAYWGKFSPVLFPIVGQLKDDTYYYNNKAYHMPRHGLARERMFEMIHADNTKASFLLRSNADTLKIYPFDFEFYIHYTLDDNKLTITYEVKNTGTDTLYFSVGGHPAFAVPLVPGTNYNDYYLEFEEMETADRWTLKDNYIDKPIPVLKHEKRIPITHELFHKDALVFKHLQSSVISIKSDATLHGLSIDCGGFPYLGIWSAKDAPFVCIEPWHGIADSVDHNQQLTEKEGILPLDSGHIWQSSWHILCY